MDAPPPPRRDQAPPPRHEPPPPPPRAERDPGHTAACSRRYRSYNPRTDMYVARPGMMRRCTL
ncbi:BA14K family protein [Roseomonas mucosa]